MAMHHLSGVDASFLHLETPETPMHVGSLMLFDLPAGYKGDYYEDVRALIAKRMHLAGIFHRKLAQMPFELAEPVWIEDDDIDLDYHVRSVTLRKPGSMAQLEALVARLHSTLLDRSRPLWEVYVIDGLASGQIGYYTKAHHSGVDGKAGVEMAKAFYDITPEPREVRPPRPTRGNREYQLGIAELLQAALSNAATQYTKAGRMLPTALKALNTVRKVLAARKQAPGERSLNLGLAPKTIFNVSITNQRSYATMSVPLEQLKALGKRAGGTVNTVVMSMCASALRRYLRERGQLPEKSLIAMVPVSLRGADDDSMNNQVSAIRVDLATDLADPLQRFKAIHASSEDAKGVVSALKPVLGTDIPVTGSPWVMTGLASLYGRSNLPSRMPPMANVTISNVPGLPLTLYMAGAKMVNYYPVSIPYHGASLNITVQSYDGKMEFGITVCRRVMSQAEAHEMIDYLRKALHEIEELPRADPPAAQTAAAATAPTPKPKSRTKAAAPATPKAAARPAARKRTVAKKTLEAPAAKRTRAARAAAAA